jgi:carboxyl-terminal processing protease
MFMGLIDRRIIYSILLVLLVSCKKDPKVKPGTTGGNTPPATGTRSELTKDSIYLYAKEIYYWYDALPSYDSFNPRKYTSGSSDLANYNLVLFNLSQIKINPATGNPFEFLAGAAGYPKYSYIKDKTTQNPVTYAPGAQGSVDLEGNGNDMGLAFAAIGPPTAFEVRVKYVSPGSPAAKAGIKRGDIITTFNKKTVGTNFSTESVFIDNAVAGNTVELGGKTKDGLPINVTLTKAAYKSSPIYKDTVIVSGTKRIGYFAYARFSVYENSDPPITQIFEQFAKQKVTDLVVDLRYNGGGYITSASNLANLIAPWTVNGKLMFKEKFNTLMQTGKATILKNQPLLDGEGKVRFSNSKLVTYLDVDYTEAGNTYTFQKTGSLDGIQNVVFIITGSTASASELVINCLKPYINVKLVGTTSYGKPIGFFPITLENRYDVYYSMFTSINSKGEGEFFAGFKPDFNASDDVTRDFGDPNEVSFAAALSYLTKGSFTAISNKISVKGESVNPSTVEIRSINGDGFNGMIETRFKLKK